MRFVFYAFWEYLNLRVQASTQLSIAKKLQINLGTFLFCLCEIRPSRCPTSNDKPKALTKPFVHWSSGLPL